jgi:hypothetical protein
MPSRIDPTAKVSAITFCVTFVKAIDVLAYRRHRIFRAYLVTPFFVGARKQKCR